MSSTKKPVYANLLVCHSVASPALITTLAQCVGACFNPVTRPQFCVGIGITIMIYNVTATPHGKE